jgi:uncharacterized RDD family membrane protein YckC
MDAFPPPPPPPPPLPPRSSSSSTQVQEAVPQATRLPRLEDFPEAGPNALATFQQRGIARIVDELLVTLPVVGLELSLVDADLTRVIAGVFAVQLIYEIVAVAVWGRTVGKYAMGIRVARYTDGGKPTWAQASLRCLLWGVPGALALVVLQASAFGALPVFLTAYRDQLRRALHDEAGGTIVVRTR